ncbi:MAG: hypothetical protein OEQ13_10445 [Acidobacteriota bacterium]|nr:hypothetical protein [Acidobacteriota bacterium]
MPRRSGAEIARLASLFAGLALLVVFARPQPVPTLAGGILVALGEAIRIWAAGHLLKTRLLVTSGPYRYTRNPMYLGRLLILSGLVTMAWLPYGLSLLLLTASWGLFLGYYMPRKERVEPARLLLLHGEAYAAYRRAVPALFPRPSPWKAGSERAWCRARFHRSREILTIVGLTLLALLIVMSGEGGSPGW